MKERKFVFFDLETTGLSPVEDRVIQFACHILEEEKFTDSVDIYINPGIELSPKIEELTGITNDFLRNNSKVLTEETAFEIIRKVIEEADILVGHNIICFDIPFLQEMYRRNGSVFPEKNTIDTLVLARNMLNSPSNKLSYLVENVVKKAGYNYHNACGDVCATVELYKFLKKQFGLN